MDKRKIDEYIKNAILENNVAKREAYRAIKADILLLETSKNFKGEVKEADIIKIIRKIIAQKEESITMYESNKPDLGNRMETINAYKEQIKYLKELLPPEISKDRINEFIVTSYPNGYIQKEMGKIIKEVKNTFPTADGKIIAEIVKNHITNE